MSTQPQVPHPDTIEPQSPPETPATPSPSEAPMREPPEVTPSQPDIDQPGRGPDEMPPPSTAADNYDAQDPAPHDLSGGGGEPDIGQGGVLQSNLDGPIAGSVE